MAREWESLNANKKGDVWVVPELARMHRDGHCHEALKWYVHHLWESMKTLKLTCRRTRSGSREPKLQESCLQVRRVRLRQQRDRSAGRLRSAGYDCVNATVPQGRLRHQRARSAGYDCVNNATVPQGRLRHQRARSAGYDCVNNATVPQGRLRNQRNVAQKPWGGPPSCDPAPLTTSLRGLWVSGNAGTGQWLLRTKGRRPKNRPSDKKGRRPKNRPTKGGTL